MQPALDKLIEWFQCWHVPHIAQLCFPDWYDILAAAADYRSYHPCYALDDDDFRLARSIGQLGLLMHFVLTRQHPGGSTEVERQAWVGRVSWGLCLLSGCSTS
jgi:hypothetical protein